MNPEFEAAARMLNIGMEAQVTAPLLFRLFGKREINVLIRAPFYGTMSRTSFIYLKRRISEKQLDQLDENNFHILYLKHAPALYKVAANAWINNNVLWLLFGWLVTMFFKSHLNTRQLYRFISVEALLSSRSAFSNTIRLVHTMKVTTPNLSQQIQGS
jgi:hypothetical protein